MVSPSTHWATVLRAYLRRGEAGLAEVAERLESTAHDLPDGKFDKDRALYLPQAPIPPTIWRTSCGRCRFWEEGGPGEPGRCHIVGREGDPFGGEAIHYRGWCAFWMPPAGEPPFAWIGERLHPDGKSAVRGVYDPVVTERGRRRERRDRADTEPDGRRAAIHGDADGESGDQNDHREDGGTRDPADHDGDSWTRDSADHHDDSGTRDPTTNDGGADDGA